MQRIYNGVLVVWVGVLAVAGCASLPAPKSMAEADGTSSADRAAVPVEAKPSALPPLAPEQTGQHMALALSQLRDGDLPLAQSLFEAIVAVRKDIPEAWFNLGLVNLKQRKAAEAVAALNNGLAIRPDDARALNLLGQAYRQQGLFAQAEAAYLRGLLSDPKAERLHLNLGILYEIYLNHPEKALHSYRQYQSLLSSPDVKVDGWIALLERQSGRPLAELSRTGAVEVKP